jgi:hypothetical protein
MRQNGPRTISSIDAPYDLGITQWSDSEITALADGALGCAKTTLTIARKTQEAFWLDEPVNLAEPQCKDADRQTRRYSIEDSPGRKKLHN